MIKNSYIFLLLIIYIVCSCSEPQEKNDHIKHDSLRTTIDIKEIKVDSSKKINDNVEIYIADTIADIQFDDLLVSIEGLAIFKDTVQSSQKDTVFVDKDIINKEPFDPVQQKGFITTGGGTIQGTTIKIVSDKYKDISIETRYETSPMIMNGGEDCYLTNWKHYYSDWKALKKIGDYKFVSPEYSLEDHEKFIKVNMDELKEAVRENCGEFYFERIIDAKSPTDIPCAIRISSYYLRVTGYSKVDGKKIVKFIIVDSAFGC